VDVVQPFGFGLESPAKKSMNPLRLTNEPESGNFRDGFLREFCTAILPSAA